MSISIRQDFKSEIAKMFLDDLQFQRGRYYYFLGGVEPWSGIGNEGETDLPLPQPITNEYDRKIRSEMVFAKYISPNDASLVIRKVLWESGTHYDHWDHTIGMDDKDFYVINSSNEVFKCLDNNDLFGEPNLSTVEPNIVSIYPFRTSDGYLWKYMYTISSYANSRFSSNDFMPVKRALSDSFYNNGAVDDAVVLTEGSLYPDVLVTRIDVSGSTSGQDAVIEIGTVDAFGAITSIDIVDGGTGYTNGVRLKVDSPIGAGAVITATVTAGVITSVTIVSAGIGYSASDTIDVELGGAVLVPIISRTTGSIVDVKIVDAGVGYSAATLTINVLPGYTPGTGKFGNPTAILEAVVFQGSIQIVNILDPGINYPFDNSTTISIQGDGENAAFTPVIIDGRVVDVIVENPGSGYTDINLTVQSDTGSGALLRGVITQSDYVSDQSVVEQTTVDGAVYSFVVESEGAEYSSNTYVELTGNGTGCIAEPIIVGGKIKAVRVSGTNFGSGYTNISVRVIDPIRPDEERTPQQIASVYAVLPPVGGHGRDAPTELLCKTVSLNTPLRGDLVINQIFQDFRLFGILKNPRNVLTGAKFTEQSSILSFIAKSPDTSGLVKDSVYKLGENRYRIVDINGASVYLLPLSDNNLIPIGTLFREDNQSIQLVITEITSSFTMDKYSGKLLYVSTETPFEFSADQSITVKTFITF